MHRAARSVGTFILIAAGVAVLSAQNSEWRAYSSDPGSTKYVALDQINASNVAQMKVVWRRPAVDAQLMALNPKLTFSNNFRATPLMMR